MSLKVMVSPYKSSSSAPSVYLVTADGFFALWTINHGFLPDRNHAAIFLASCGARVVWAVAKKAMITATIKQVKLLTFF